MSPKNFPIISLVTSMLLVAACQDQPEPTAPGPVPSAQAALQQPSPSAAQRAAWFRRVTPEIMALPQTVFADDHEASGLLVIGVEHAGAIAAVRAVLTRHGVPAAAYRIDVSQPIHHVIDLQGEHRPVMGGIQIVLKKGTCTLGFNVDHGDGLSFITNSHCSMQSGKTEGTDYHQPVIFVPPQFAEIIADEVDDPAYFTGGDCSRGKKCRLSDATRALYRSAITDAGEVALGAIARTSGADNGSLEVVGQFTITQQGDPTGTEIILNKVGRTTGWTSGAVGNTCATVNIFGSNVQLLCQTFVHRAGAVLLGGGDSGSPVFQILTGTNVRLVGILWGGSSNNDTFVFSPISGIVAELGTLDAVP